MEGGWGNILYIVLMVLFVIFGALKKKRPVNNLQADVDSQSEGEMSTSVEDIFGSLLGGNAFEAQEEHPYRVMQEEIVEEEVVDLQREEIKTEPVKYSSPILMEFEDDEEDDEFDWKQAIISREILDRKYI